MPKKGTCADIKTRHRFWQKMYIHVQHCCKIKLQYMHVLMCFLFSNLSKKEEQIIITKKGKNKVNAKKKRNAS